MHAAYWLVVLAVVLAAASTDGHAPELRTCVRERLYLTEGSRERAIYTAMHASGGAECREAALQVACTRYYASAHGMSDRDLVCTLNCAGWLSATCPDVVLLADTCGQVAPSLCEQRRQTLARALVA